MPPTMRLTPEPVIDDRVRERNLWNIPSSAFQLERFYDRRARIRVVFNTRSKLVPEAVKTAPKFSIVCCIYAAKSPAASSKLNLNDVMPDTKTRFPLRTAWDSGTLLWSLISTDNVHGIPLGWSALTHATSYRQSSGQHAAANKADGVDPGS